MSKIIVQQSFIATFFYTATVTIHSPFTGIRKVREVMGLIPVSESDFFFVPHLYHVYKFTFHKKKLNIK